jgi:modulator of FtsH protease
MADQVILQEWQSYFVAFAGASAALAGLVFVAMSLHPGPILVNALTRGRAFVAAFGFLIGVAWALIMLLPARTAPVGAVLLIALGVVESAFIIYLQFQVRRTNISVARLLVSDILLLTPVLAGTIGLLQPYSEVPFVLLAIAGGIGLFVLFSQSWTLVLHDVMNTPDSQHQAPSKETVLNDVKKVR